MSTAHSRSAAAALPAGLTVLQRGWLSSNNVLFDEGDRLSLVDSGYVLHAEQTAHLVQRLCAGRPLARIVNTHLHSDHVGGNALLAQRHGAPVFMPAGLAAAVRDWDTDALTYAPTGQQCPRFMYSGLLHDGDRLDLGRRPWQVLAAPGHDPHMVMLLQADDGVLISADALWENGFGAIFPEIEGESGFAEQAAALDLIERHAPRVVIPGHGAPFTDVAGALARARARLAALSASPARNARHVAKVLIKFRLLQVRRAAWADLLAWAAAARYFTLIHSRYFEGAPFASMIERAVDELVSAGVAARIRSSEDETVENID
jgi:glyoxylase-like metal-dependent hydrolase (beta-lactamase superfamily II)